MIHRILCALNIKHFCPVSSTLPSMHRTRLGLGLFLNISLKYWLEADKTNLCTFICLLSSPTSVTSWRYSMFLLDTNVWERFEWKSFHFKQNFSAILLNLNHIKIHSKASFPRALQYKNVIYFLYFRLQLFESHFQVVKHERVDKVWDTLILFVWGRVGRYRVSHPPTPKSR